MKVSIFQWLILAHDVIIKSNRSEGSAPSFSIIHYPFSTLTNHISANIALIMNKFGFIRENG